MKCPYCSNFDTKVIDSRMNQSGDLTRRRRECPNCEGRFTTYERIEEVMPVVTKKDGRRETFNRDKIKSSLTKPCQKRPVTTDQIEAAIQRIERRIQMMGAKEIPSKALGQLVMEELLKLDKVAYIRFASVYREFRDVEEFVAELKDAAAEPQNDESLKFPFAATLDEVQ